MNSEEAFSKGQSVNDEKIVDALISGDVTRAGGNYIEGKSKEEVLAAQKEDDESKMFGSEWESGEKQDEWKMGYEDGILKFVYKNDNSYMLFKILEEKFPELGVEIKEAEDDLGVPRDDVVSIMVSRGTAERSIVKEITEHPIIKLLICSPGSRFTFDSVYAHVEGMRLLPKNIMERIKARFLLQEYEYEKQHGDMRAAEETEKEIKSNNKFMSNDEVRLLLESTIMEVLHSKEK